MKHQTQLGVASLAALEFISHRLRGIICNRWEIYFDLLIIFARLRLLLLIDIMHLR